LYGQHSASLDVVVVVVETRSWSSSSEVFDVVRWVVCGGVGEVRFEKRAACGCGGVSSSARREVAAAELEEEEEEEEAVVDEAVEAAVEEEEAVEEAVEEAEEAAAEEEEAVEPELRLKFVLAGCECSINPGRVCVYASWRGGMEGQGQKEPFMHGSRQTRPSGQKKPGQHVAAFHRSVPKNPGEQLGLERPYLRERRDRHRANVCSRYTRCDTEEHRNCFRSASLLGA